MTASTKLAIFVLFSILISITPTSVTYGADQGCERPLSILVSDSFPPFSEKDPNGAFHGMDIETIQATMEKAGCEYSFEVLPWKRGLLMLEEGKLDLVAFASITPERKKFANFSHPYRYERIRLIMRKEHAASIEISSLKDIVRQGLVIGNSAGTYRGPAFAEFAANHENSKNLVDVPSSTHGIQMLLAKRIDALVADQSVALAIADGLDANNQIAAHSYKIFDKPVHLMASKKSVSTETLNKLNAALEDILDQEVYN